MIDQDAFEPKPQGFDRLDADCLVYLAYDRPDHWILKGGVCRGFSNEEPAREYARRASAFFAANGVSAPVFVVRGPTSTSPRARFEVCDASSHYSIVAQYQMPAAAVAPEGMSLRIAIAQHGIKVLSGRPLQLEDGRTVYVPPWHLAELAAHLVNAPQDALRLRVLQGADSPDCHQAAPFEVMKARLGPADTCSEQEGEQPAPADRPRPRQTA